jgi:plasmid replication initiation protein
MKNRDLYGYIPEYAIEPTLISQGMFKLSSYAQKLMTMAMAFISIEKGNYTASFKTSDFLKTIGLEVRKQGDETKKYVQAAVKECLESSISIKMPHGEWEGYTWFTKSKLHKVNQQDGIWEEITMEFNPALGDVIKELKRGFSQIDIPSLVKLQSKYAIRFFRLALSYSGFAGKNGNPLGQWYFEMSIEDIRIRFQIDKDTYPRTGNFRTFVIDEPIEEINAADVGLQIEVEYIRQGRYLTGARFNCRWLRKKPIELAYVNIQEPAEKDCEDEALAAKYPEEYEKYKSEYLERMTEKYAARPEMLELLEHAAEGHALEKLKEMHAAPAPPNASPQKRGRGRPRKNPVP